MHYSLTEKILREHLLEGDYIQGHEIGIGIDQTLTQDSTGTMAYLQLEAMEIDQVRTKKSVAYVDHNMLQQGFENADDHLYIQTVANKHGIYFSRPGNGICHQVHLERFAVPGDTLLGSDSHTPTCGGMGMLAIGAGGLDVAVAMGGGTYYIQTPEVVNVVLEGELSPFVTAKDIILEVLRRMTVKGGVGRVIEYSGDGVKTLTVPERATITNMGAELGATTSIFPSDNITKQFLKAQGREEDYRPLAADKGASYGEQVVIDLSALEPLVAKPHSPDNVSKVSEEEGLAIQQVCIGSCTNSSFQDMMKVAKILKGETVPSHVSLVIAPGSKQVLTMLAENGALADMITAGARILESGCGPCIGMGQAPSTDAVSLRTFNRNFKGRCGTISAGVYLVSPETAAVSALYGHLADPRKCEKEIVQDEPKAFYINDNMIVAPEVKETAKVVKGPNIKPFPLNEALSDSVDGKILIKVEDNITTDHIMPSNAKLLPFRSNIPHLSNFCLTPCDDEFPDRARSYDGGFILGGDNYGQGSSREHAALVPLYLGIKAVFAKSFARIHKANLVNSGILPLTFRDKKDYDSIDLMDDLRLAGITQQLQGKEVVLENVTKGLSYIMEHDLSEKEMALIYSGGKINWMKAKEA